VSSLFVCLLVEELVFDYFGSDDESVDGEESECKVEDGCVCGDEDCA
jgi:hypothetical protein